MQIWADAFQEEELARADSQLKSTVENPDLEAKCAPKGNMCFLCELEFPLLLSKERQPGGGFRTWR
jgi:hypothetical protein